MAQTVLNETQIPDVVTDSTMYGTGKTGDPLGISGTSLPYNFVTGSIAFADSAGFLIEDNKHLRYNSTLRSVRMGKDAPFNNFADLFPFFATAEFAGESIVNGVYAYGTGTSGLPLPGFGSYRSRGTPEAPTVVKKDDVLGSFYGTGYDGADFYNGGRVRFYADVDWTTGANRASRTSFLVTPSGTTSQVEKMVLYGDSLNLINTGTYNVNGTPHTHSYIPNDGWIEIRAMATSATLDAPSFEISFNADMTGFIGLGYKIKLTQSTTKYFIVTKVGAYSGGETIVTCYGGTDYTLVASGTTAITNTYFSPVKAPFGFPLATTKWTVTASDTTTRSQASPTPGTWYNLGSISISAPIGLWRHVTSILPTVDRVADGNLDIYVTLSTANNSQSDASVTRKLSIRTGVYAEISTIMESILDLTSKTTYYINSKCDATVGNIYNNNGAQALSIKLICDYL